MYEIKLILEPTEFLPWFGRSVAVILISYVAIWLIALVLWRWQVLSKSDPVLRVELGWLIPLCLHSIVLTALVLYLAIDFKELGISLWHLVVFLVPIVFSVVQGLERRTNVDARLKRAIASRKQDARS